MLNLLIGCFLLVLFLLFFLKQKKPTINKQKEFQNFMEMVFHQPQYIHPAVLEEKLTWLKNHIKKLEGLSKKKKMEIESLLYNYKLYSSGPFNGPQDHLIEKAMALEEFYEDHLNAIKYYKKCYSTLNSLKSKGNFQ